MEARSREDYGTAIPVEVLVADIFPHVAEYEFVLRAVCSTWRLAAKQLSRVGRWKSLILFAERSHVNLLEWARTAKRDLVWHDIWAIREVALERGLTGVCFLVWRWEAEKRQADERRARADARCARRKMRWHRQQAAAGARAVAARPSAKVELRPLPRRASARVRAHGTKD
jgi:hypothetical protein